VIFEAHHRDQPAGRLFSFRSSTLPAEILEAGKLDRRLQHHGSRQSELFERAAECERLKSEPLGLVQRRRLSIILSVIFRKLPPGQRQLK
jgi:hypothetical protein